ncbi:MAG: MFS transporter [Oscillospiraceae bacterium]|nr:MFS transporter [Oscillospiraceae bacterium]
MKQQTSQPGSGFRWLVLVGSVIIALCIGLLYLWSIYVRPMCEQYGWDTDQVALMGNVMMATLCLGGFIGGQLLPKVGSKVCGILGAALYGGFMFLSSFVTSPAMMYVTYGIISGTGCGILYNSMMYTLGLWFPDRRGLAMGIYLGFFGLSTTLWSKPISGLLVTIGVKSTMMILGLAFLAVILVIAVFIMRMPPEGWLPEGYVPPAEKANANSKSLTVREGLRTRAFWQITIAQVLLVITYNFINPYVSVFVVEQTALAAETAVSIVAVMGIGSLCGRLAGGFLADTIGNKLAYLVACGSSVLACVVLIPAAGPVTIGIMFFLLAFGYGARTPIYGTLAVDNFGARNSSALAGFTNLFTISTSLLSGIITASIRRATGSFNGAFYVAIAAAVVGCACILLMSKVKPIDTK